MNGNLKLRRKELGIEQVLPVTLEIQLDDVEHGDPVTKTEFVKCHFYLVVNHETGYVDTYVVEGGRMRMGSSYSKVLSVHEVDPEDAHG